MKIKNTEIKVLEADITSFKVDAIVNAANNKLVMGGGVAGAIKRKAEALQAKYVIHAATMGLDFETDEAKIRNSCRSSLELAEKLRISSIAFPALGCGTGGFPYLATAKIMAQEVYRHLRTAKSGLKEIIFCLYDKKTAEIFEKGVLKYLEHIVEVLQNGPFTTVDVIIEYSKDEIILIERSNPPFGWALPGGFLDYGESLEEAVTREAKEETGLELSDLKQMHTYSDPQRDPRFQTIGTVFIAKSKGTPEAGDDAASLKVVKLSQIDKFDFAFDHKKIIQDYIKLKNGTNPY